jgi:hypothetical protein
MSDFEMNITIDHEELDSFLNFKKLSINLGLHKESYNFVKSS